jgi:bla regulator protein BlaR1
MGTMTAFAIRKLTLLAAALAAGMFAPAALAQSPANQPAAAKPLAFEVVSIRPNKSPLHEGVAVTPDGWHMTHGPLILALLTAYVPQNGDAMMYTVSTLNGVPDWAMSETYDIDAKVSEADLAAWKDPAKQPAMLHAMLQTALAERCKLAAHRGSKEVAVYSLILAKGGPKFKEAVAGEKHPGSFPIPDGGELVFNDGAGNMHFYGTHVGALAVILSNVAGRPVENNTGLTARYDMALRRPQVGGPSTEADSGPDSAPTIFSVVGDLGLKLVPAKSSVETLFIDHLEKPSEN